MAPPVLIDEPPPTAGKLAHFALWQLGFRPFFLLASVFAKLSIGLWAAQFAGWLPGTYLAGPLLPTWSFTCRCSAC